MDPLAYVADTLKVRLEEIDEVVQAGVLLLVETANVDGAILKTGDFVEFRKLFVQI